MHTRVRLAVVGCGYWGSRHVRVLSEIESADMALAIDKRQARLDPIQHKYPTTRVCQDFDFMLRDRSIDGVVIATPMSSHFHLAREALLAGKHVMVEKPLATSSDECRQLIALANQRNLTLMVGHTFEYHPAVEYLRGLIQSGSLGKLRYVDTARLNLGLYQPDCNVLWDLAPHDFSILFYLLDEPVSSMSAWGSSHTPARTEDVAFVNLSFASHVTGHVHTSWLDPCKVRRVTVVGSERMVVFNDVSPTDKVRIYDKRCEVSPEGDSFADFQATYHHGDTLMPAIDTTEPLKLECQDFVNAIATGQSPRADGVSGLRVVQALEAATRSMNNGSRVERIESDFVPPLEIVRQPFIANWEHLGDDAAAE